MLSDHLTAQEVLPRLRAVMADVSLLVEAGEIAPDVGDGLIALVHRSISWLTDPEVAAR